MEHGNRSDPGCPEHIRAGRGPRSSAASMPRWVHSARVPKAGLSGWFSQSPDPTPGLLLTVTPSCASGIRTTLPPSSRSSFDPDGKIARSPCRRGPWNPLTKSRPQTALASSAICTIRNWDLRASNLLGASPLTQIRTKAQRRHRHAPTSHRGITEIAHQAVKYPSSGDAAHAYEKKGGKCKQGVARHGRLSNVPYRKSLSAQREKRPFGIQSIQASGN